MPVSISNSFIFLYFLLDLLSFLPLDGDLSFSPLDFNFLVVGSNILRDLWLWYDQVQNLNSVFSESNNTFLDPGFDIADYFQKLCVVDFINGVVGTVKPKLLFDPIKHQSLSKVCAVFFDQWNNSIVLHITDDCYGVENIGNSVFCNSTHVF